MRKKRAVYYIECPTCGRSVCTGALTRHQRACERLSSSIPGKSRDGNPGHKGGNQYTKAKTLGLPKPEVSEATRQKLVENARHRHPTEATRKKMSDAAKRRQLGGHTSKQRIVYKGVQLHSSYETAVAIDLDANNVEWIRPSPLLWVDAEGASHRYYADFYLPKYNIYLDPKNDFLAECVNPYFGMSDKDKIQQVALQNNVRIYILNKDQLAWSFIKTLC